MISSHLPGSSLRYSPSFSETAANPSGSREVLTPKASAVSIYLTHCKSVKDLLHGYPGGTITLWSLLKKFCVYELVTLLEVLAECERAYEANTALLPSLRETL